jgi:FMN phosphatase YigB (HAD superfamily)
VPIAAVIFDAFGTLLQIGKGLSPYKNIIKLGIEQGRRPKASDVIDLLSKPMDLRQAADFYGIQVSSRYMYQLESDLQRELASIQAYPDGIAAVAGLKAFGLKVIVCSNLAQPYALPIERLYPELDGYVYSFSVGAIKPSFEIYDRAAQLAGASPREIWMIGDSERCDCAGPTEFGMHGHFLDRTGVTGYRSLDEFALAVLRAR